MKRMQKIFTFIIGMVAMLATACSEYQEVVDYEPIVLNSPESVEVEGLDNSSFKVSYTALSRVEMSTDCNWIVVPNNFDGNSNGTFTITTLPNSTITERTGKLILTATDPRFAGGMSYSKSITVTQGGGRPTINAYIKSAINTKSYTAPDEGETVNLYVKSNAYFEVSSSAAWIKFNNNSSYSGKGGDAYVTIAMTIAPNPDEWDRGATITISGKANGAGQNYDIAVKQSKWNTILQVYPSTFNFDYKEQTKSVTVYSNFSWTATCEYDNPNDTGWVELTNDKYTSNDKYTAKSTALDLIIKENASVIDRTARIVIKGTDKNTGTITKTITITQTGRPELYFYDTAYSVGNMAGDYSVKFLSENAWVASTDATWLTISKTSGDGIYKTQYLSFSVQPNTSNERRTATITLKVNDDSNVNTTLTVVQGSAGELYYRSSQMLNLTWALFDVTIAEHTFDEARGEGRVTFNGTMTALTDQEQSSDSAWKSATAVYLPSTVKSIGNSAFWGCGGIDLPLPAGLERIGDHAFELCAISAFNIPSSVTEIGEGAFLDCDYITDIVIPEGVKAIKSFTFRGCDRLTSVTLTDGVASIGDGAFRYCTALKEITIPEGVKTIEDDTFYDCSSLARITLPSTLASIGSGAFVGCTSLKRVDISDIAKWCKINFGYNNPLYVANAALYLNGSEVTEIDAQTMGIESFSEYCFTGCSSITSLSAIRKDVGKHAFGDCPNLKTVRNLSKIGDYAFRNCKNLQTISSLYSADIGKSAFEGCTALTSISHSSSSYSYTVSVGTRAFYGCTNLDTITLPSDGRFANNIGDSAFEGCTSLTKIVVGDKYDEAMSVGNNAFKGCTALNSVEFNYGRQISIYDSAFEGCNNLSRLTIPSSLNYGLFIKSRAFYGCDALAEVNLGSYIQSIGENAFYRIEGKLTITCKASTPPKGAAQMFPIPPTVDLTIKVPTKYVDAYKSATYWKDYADYIVGN